MCVCACVRARDVLKLEGKQAIKSDRHSPDRHGIVWRVSGCLLSVGSPAQPSRPYLVAYIYTLISLSLVPS